MQTVVLALATVLAFLPTFGAGFIWDDYTYLIHNELIQAADGLRRIWFTREAVDFWPLSSTFFYLEWRLFGEHPLGYHIVNVGLHFANASLLLLVLRQLHFRFAFLTALLFAVHPVAVDTVAWVIQTKTTLASFLGLCSVYSYLRFRKDDQTLWWGVSLLAFAMSLLAKTHLVMLPFVYAVFEWHWRRDAGSKRRALVSLAPFFAVAAAIGWVAMSWYPGLPLPELANRSLLEKAADAAFLLWFYAGKILAPFSLSFAYSEWRELDRGLLRYAGLVFLGALIALAYVFRRRRLVGTSMLGLLCFALLLFPVLGFMEVYFMRYSVAADHWQYPAYALVLVVLTSALGHLAERFNTSARTAIAVIVVAALIGLTLKHSKTYHNEESVWRATLAQYPDSSLARNNLGILLEKQGKPGEARQQYLEVLIRNPNDVEANVNMGAYYVNQSQAEQAIPHLQRALLANPDSADGSYNLGLAYAQLNRFTTAIPYYEMAIKLNPRLWPAHNNLGIALSRAGRLQDSRQTYERALKLGATDGKLHFNYASVLEQLGEREQAHLHFRRAADLMPGHPAVQQKMKSLVP